MDKTREISSSSSFTAKPAYLLAGAFVLLNLMLKGKFLAANDIALDEPFSIFHAQQSLGDLQSLFAKENNPPLHFWLLHFWIKAFGIGPLAVRFPFLLCSSLAAGVTYFIGRRHFGQAAGVGAALIFTLSTEQTFYAHEARTFALFLLLAALSTGSFLRAGTDSNSQSSWYWLTLWNILLLYTHFLAIPFIGMQALASVVLFPNRRQALLRWLLSGGILLAAWFPQLWLFYQRLQVVSTEGGTWVSRPTAWHLVQVLAEFVNGGWPLLVAGMTVLAVGVWLTLHKRWPEREQARPLILLVVLMGGTYLGLFCLSWAFTSVFIGRYLIFLAIPFYWILAGIWAQAGKGRVQWLVFAPFLLVMGFFLHLNPSNHRHLKDMVDRVEANRPANTPVILCNNHMDLAYLYHYAPTVFRDYPHAHERFRDLNHHAVSDWLAFDRYFLRDAKGAWVINGECEMAFESSTLYSELYARFGMPRHYIFPAIYDVWEFKAPKDSIDPMLVPEE